MSKSSQQRKRQRQTLFGQADTRRLMPAVSADTTKETAHKILLSLRHQATGRGSLLVSATPATPPRLPDGWENAGGQMPPEEIRDTIRRNLERIEPAGRWRRRTHYRQS